MRAGLVGLGRMGRAMAGHLLGQGVELSVWNRTPERAQGLGAEVAGTPAELVSRVPVVILSLLDSAAVTQVLEGQDGLLHGECAGRVFLDTTTNHYGMVERFHRAASERGAAYLECPVAGSVGPASKGQLAIFVSGARAALEQARGHLEQLGQVYELGEKPGLASRFKLINNMVLGSFMCTLAEAVGLAEEIGIPKAQALELLGAGAGKSGVLDAKRGKLLREDFGVQYPAALLSRDLEFLYDLGEELRGTLFTGRLARELYALTLSKGYDDLDFSVVYKALKEL